ncbi:MAG: helix-turn-helix domain-containing protein [Candidatus Limnocylindrales bacterium]
MIATDDDRLDALGHAVADSTRRGIIRHLRSEAGATTSDLAGLSPTMTRFAVMKHLEVLRRADIVRSMSDGRRRRHYLEPRALDPLGAWLEGEA